MWKISRLQNIIFYPIDSMHELLTLLLNEQIIGLDESQCCYIRSIELTILQLIDMLYHI